MTGRRSIADSAQQIKYLNEELLGTIRNFKNDKSQDVLEYRYDGYLFAQTKEHFEKLGLILSWVKGPEVNGKLSDGHWLFTLPNYDIDLSKLR